MVYSAAHSLAGNTPAAYVDVAPAVPSWLAGVYRYQQCGYVRPACTHPVIWKRDRVLCLKLPDPSGRLLDDAPAILFTPSLINRYYILDLDERLSVARYFAQRGMHVYMIDWGTPDTQKSGKDAASYVTRYLLPLIAQLSSAHGQPIHLMGYCIGGLLNIAASLLMPEQVCSNVTLATPWDFSADDVAPMMLNAMSERDGNADMLLSGHALAMMFYLASPQRFRQKYEQFARMDEGSDAYHRFIAAEHWVNDVVPITRAFAQDCFLRWIQQNWLARYRWRVGGKIVDPASLNAPLCVVTAKRDHIVSHDNAAALAGASGNAHLISSNAGHLGMIIGSGAQREVWQPVHEWLQNQ